VSHKDAKTPKRKTLRPQRAYNQLKFFVRFVSLWESIQSRTLLSSGDYNKDSYIYQARKPFFMRTYLISATTLFLVLGAVIALYSCNKGNGTDGEPPVAGFSYTSASTVPVTVQFVNTSTATAGGPSSFKWDFGDGTIAQTIDATHVYTQSGVYIIKLVQTPSTGAADSVAQVLSLSNIPGPAGISNRMHGIQGVSFISSISSRAYTVTFINSSANANNYLWKFGDGVTTTTDSATVVHTYMASGTYHVNLSASSSNSTDTSGATIIF
jgi:PKD repeat protein